MLSTLLRRDQAPNRGIQPTAFGRGWYLALGGHHDECRKTETTRHSEPLRCELQFSTVRGWLDCRFGERNSVLHCRLLMGGARTTTIRVAVRAGVSFEAIASKEGRTFTAATGQSKSAQSYPYHHHRGVLEKTGRRRRPWRHSGQNISRSTATAR